MSRGHVRQDPPTEREMQLSRLVRQLAELQMQQTELLRTAGYLPEYEAEGLVDEFDPNTFLQGLADRFYGGDRRKARILLARVLTSTLQHDEE